jgi:hypothetical protein
MAGFGAHFPAPCGGSRPLAGRCTDMGTCCRAGVPLPVAAQRIAAWSFAGRITVFCPFLLIAFISFYVNFGQSRMSFW